MSQIEISEGVIMATMTDFRVENLTKSVGDKTVFSQLNFIIHPLDRIGLIGVNGTGKTTLLDVISGKLALTVIIHRFLAVMILKLNT
jgi:ATPase subunit of ABC transporter with duplicated ATPase domains